MEKEKAGGGIMGILEGGKYGDGGGFFGENPKKARKLRLLTGSGT
jgi:hypothetical protein